MRPSKLLMIGPFPEPYTGQSISFEKLFDSFDVFDDTSVLVVNTQPNKGETHITGKVSIARLLETFFILFSCFKVSLFNKIDYVYLTKGSTLAGFLRDLFVLLLVKATNFNCRVTVHLKGGNYDTFYEAQNTPIKSLIRYFLKRVDAIIVLGYSLVDMYSFIPAIKHKLFVIENAIPSNNTPEYAPRSAESKSINILFLSNLIVSKGYLNVFNVVSQLNVEGYNCRLTLAGELMESPDDPADIKELQAGFLKGIAASSNAKYVGPVSGSLKVSLLQEADIFVLPTNYHVEGQPVSILEAMSYSCAIIATHYRSIPDIVTTENCTFVEYNNETELKNALIGFIEDAAQLESFQKASYNRFIQKYTWAKHFEKMRKVVLNES